MKEIVVTEQNERRVKIIPCVKCGNEDIDIYNCGYSSFNVAGGKCKKCNNEVKINNCSWNITNLQIAEYWNKENDPKILRLKYEQQIIEIQKLIDALPK